MKQIWIRKPGPPEVLTRRESADPLPRTHVDLGMVLRWCIEQSRSLAEEVRIDIVAVVTLFTGPLMAIAA